MGTHGQGETGGVVLWEMSEILYLLPEQLMERIDRERQHVNLFVKTHNKSLGGRKNYIPGTTKTFAY